MRAREIYRATYLLQPYAAEPEMGHMKPAKGIIELRSALQMTASRYRRFRPVSDIIYSAEQYAPQGRVKRISRDQLWRSGSARSDGGERHGYLRGKRPI